MKQRFWSRSVTDVVGEVHAGPTPDPLPTESLPPERRPVFPE